MTTIKKLKSNRYGRAVDDTISLCLGNKLIGENLSTKEILPEKIYGSADNLWGAGLSVEDLQDSSFGIVFRFQAHPFWPHKSPVLVDTVEIRIH